LTRACSIGAVHGQRPLGEASSSTSPASDLPAFTFAVVTLAFGAAAIWRMRDGGAAA
jgi:hypothetical protein